MALIRLDANTWFNPDHITLVNDNPATQQMTVLFMDGSSRQIQGKNRTNLLAILNTTTIQGPTGYDPS